MPTYSKAGAEDSLKHFEREVTRLEAEPKTPTNKQKLAKAFRLKNFYKYVLKRLGNNKTITLPNKVN
jgi:hypothetical protein